MAEKIITLNRPNFLASEVGLRTVTYTFAKTFATAVTENGRKIIKAGTIYPANDATAVGIVFQDVDITDGDRPEALMVAGHYYSDKLSASPASAVTTAFVAKGLYGEVSPTVTVPADGLLD